MLPHSPHHRSEQDEWDMLLSIAAGILLKSPDAHAFLDWIAEAGPTLAPTVAAGVAPETGPPGLFFRAIGVPIYNAMPLPDNGFRPKPMREPGRNDPCACGSGRKYKHCCLPLKAGAPDLRGMNLLRHVLENLPKNRYASLPGSGADVMHVYDTARSWSEAGDPARAAALLEPWFAPGRELDERMEPLFDELMNLYLALGRDRKRMRVIEDVCARGDSVLRAAALQRRATILADRGEYDEAWSAFTEAQRERPDDPMLAPLEISLLASRGTLEQARERARFWVIRMERARDPELADLIGFMRDVAADPTAALSQMSREQDPDLDRLAALVAGAPPIEIHYGIEDPEDQGLLTADAELARVEERWREVFEQVKPLLTATQHGDESVWAQCEAWLAFLEREPLAWQSFDVLDDLAMAVDALPVMSPDAALRPLLARGVALLEAVVGRCGHAPARLDWAWEDNRPALRLLAHRALSAAHSGDPAAHPAFIADAERLIALNPRDNHGVRNDLTRAYIAAGQPERSLALADAYSDDFCTLTLNRILALHRLGRLDEAQRALHAARKRHRVAIEMLLANKPARPRPSAGYGITVGGKEEAWEYRAGHRALWETGEALTWLRQAWKRERAS